MRKLFTLILSFLLLSISANARELLCELNSLDAKPENATWDATSGIFAWSAQYYNSMELYKAGDYSGYSNLHIISEAKEADHFRIIITYSNGTSQTTAQFQTGDVNKTMAELGIDTKNLPHIKSIRLSGANDCIGSISITKISLEGSDEMVYTPVILTAADGKDLDKSIYHNWTSGDKDATVTEEAVYPYVKLNTADGCPYGDSNVYYKNYADLSDYAKLVIIVNSGAPRACFNRTEDNGTVNVETPNADFQTEITNPDGTKTYIIDIKKIVEKNGFAHLHCIKGAYYANVSILRMFVVKESQSYHAVDGFRLFSCNNNLDFSEVTDVEAYIVPEIKEGKAYMQRVEGYIPANTGLLLKSKGEYTKVVIPSCASQETEITNNLISVVDATSIGIPENGKNYLFNGDKWIAISATTDVPANSSYLYYNSSESYLTAVFPTDNVTITLNTATDYTNSTFCSDYDLDFSDVNDVEVYKAAIQGDKVVTTKIEDGKVKAGTGIIIKNVNHVASVTVPVTSDIAELTGNDLVGVTADMTNTDFAGKNAYILFSDTQFRKVDADQEGTIKKGKAYLEAKTAGAKPAMLFIGDATTGIESVESQTKGDDAIYTIQGIRVKDTNAKGIYIVNGKKYKF